ncbi:putative thioredoxin protein [Clavispora lusitaniae]|uniref:Thioredoxin protein n=1 Tax=Clavispora lusitaniae TaxID=36911 RepID=A0ACD0WI18_CLALS|nr:putative thioredoxin protein [Clavispora lusitaniae]QFZ33510.1 putative thioredoxin protein [Clavispora lusitaniae]QFZ39181.1 putative thioredoxin protein [Clavispora lusitaniae]QFZ44863.1 putative thioredoxin protein [Clavispora lusitaniae]QFZ50540.1 putative thioredoxin protein [Clavispora lusitaniae]
MCAYLHQLTSPMEIQYVKNEADFESHLRQNKYLVANFTASWCGPCQAIKPMVDQIYANPKFSKIEIVRVDLDDCGPVAAKYVVTSVPTFIFFESGEEVDRAHASSLKASLDKMAERANADSASGPRGNKKLSGLESEVSSLVPKGFSVLNNVIHFGEMVALNVSPLRSSDGEADAREVFRPDSKNPTTIFTDADSQALFFVPLNYISKVYSILVKFADPATCTGDNLALDEEELSSETQKPCKIKVWPNKPGVLSFDDAAAESNPPHVETIESDAKGPWHEIRLKYVRFQNVQNLNIFLDGEDEDMHTLVEKIAIIGVSGDSAEPVTLSHEE